ncbi:Bax inhibitor-1/YccA family protein [Tessaracoccus lubricantis]|uniref:Bax inhibitor-1/YccA family protein n=1 Tax=Tessaracoccus lubricantis TaxID=545543 RepID=A0ABP9FBG4_9ACTN
MANPIIGRPDSFTKNTQQRGYTGYGQPQGYAQPQAQQAGQWQGYLPPQQQYGQGFDPYAAPQQAGPRAGGVMTLDDVLAKTAITLGAVAVAAVATFMLLPMQLLMPAVIASGIVGLVTILFVAGRRKLPVGGVLFYALVEGVFVGAFSKFFEFVYPGIVAQAVLATFVTAGATLAAYKFFNIRVTPKFRKMVTIGTIALAGVLLVNFVLAIFGVNTGLREIGSGAGWLAIGVSILAVVLAVLNLVTDFDSVERGIAAQAPAQESWRAALGITVTMVWLYVEILRIMSYFRD